MKLRMTFCKEFESNDTMDGPEYSLDQQCFNYIDRSFSDRLLHVRRRRYWYNETYVILNVIAEAIENEVY